MKTLYIKISIQFNTTLLGIGIYPTLCQILPLRAVSIFSKPRGLKRAARVFKKNP